MEINKKIYVIISIAILLSFSSAAAYAFSRSISVLIDSGHATGSLAGANMTAAGADGTSDTFSGTFDVLFEDSSVSINNKTYRMPVTISSSEALQWKSVKYRGSLYLTQSSGKYLVINNVDVEDYLKGVLKAEMNPKWPIEALKAQAVIARTYAAKSEGKHNGYDMCSTTHCQVYKGLSLETPQIEEAVSSTAGLILNWQNGPASVFYHSDSGGITASSLSVWGKQIPYLQAVTEPMPALGPHSSWQCSLPMSLIESKLAANGINTGSVASLAIAGRDESGRVSLIEIKGSLSTQRVTGHKFRTIIGSDKIKSTMFNINEKPEPVKTIPVQTISPQTAKLESNINTAKIDKSKMPKDPQEKLVWLTKNKIFTTRELMDMLAKPDKINSYIEIGMARMEGKSFQQPHSSTVAKPSAKNQINNITPAGGESITFYGMGWGHGVGMSQYGAKTLAENGWNFTGILEHYFPGTTLGQ